MIVAASFGDKFPAAHSVRTADEAFAASAAVSIFDGRSKVTRRSRLAGTSRGAFVSPSDPFSILLRVSVSALPSRSASARRVA